MEPRVVRFCTQTATHTIQLPKAAASYLLQFGTAEETKYILETLNGNIPQGLQNPVSIRPAAGSSPNAVEDQHSKQMQQGKGKGKSDLPPHVTLYVAGLPIGYTDDHLRDLFIQYGDVYSSKMLPVSGGKTTMAGFVRMPEFEGGWCVENLNNFQPEHGNFQNPLSVTVAKEQSDKGKGGMGKGFQFDTDESYSGSNGVSGFGKGDYADSFKGDMGKPWGGEKGDSWGNGNNVKSVFGSKGASWPSNKGAAGKDKGWGKEKGSDKGKSAKPDMTGETYSYGMDSNWGGGWGKGGGKNFPKGKGKKSGPY